MKNNAALRKIKNYFNLLSFLFALLLSNIIIAQFYVPISGSNTISCVSNATLYDHAGLGNYSNYANSFTVLNNSGLNTISLSGTYSTESNYDYIYIHSGAGNAGTILYSYTDSGSITSFTSTPDEIITFFFSSDFGITNTGFVFNVNYSGAVQSTLRVVPSSSVICSGSSATLTANGASTYSWTSITSSYTVIGTDVNGCSTTTSTSVFVNQLPNVTANTTNSLICAGEIETLSAGGAASYLWNTSQTTTVIAISPTITTTYTVIGTDANGCFNQASVIQDVSLCTDIIALSSIETSFVSIYPNPSNGTINIELKIKRS